MIEDTVLEGKPVFRGTEHAADELERAWEEYRCRVWRRAPFELRLDQARLNRETGHMIRTVCAMLRQSGRDLEQCQMHVQELERTIGRMQAE